MAPVISISAGRPVMKGSQALENLGEAIKRFRCGHALGDGLGDQVDVQRGRQSTAMPPEKFATQPLDTVARNGTTNAPAGRDPEPALGASPRCENHGEKPAVNLLPLPPKLQKFNSSAQAVMFPEAHAVAGRRLRGALGW
jgi:hypothetical protein